VMKRAKSNPKRGLKFLVLKPPLRLLDVSDASYATKKTSYAIEGQLNLLTQETAFKLKPGSNELSPSDFRQFLCSAGPAHPLFGSGKTAKRISHSTSHAESLSKHGSSNHSSGKPRQPSYDELLEMETDGYYDLPIDSLTDCMDLYQLVTGAKGVPQDRTQRLLILSLREKLMVHKLRHFGWLHTKDMCANNLTKPDLKDQSLNQLMDTGRFATVDTAIVRKSGSKRTQFEETDLLEMD
jgi:hypothetical protein